MKNYFIFNLTMAKCSVEFNIVAGPIAVKGVGILPRRRSWCRCGFKSHGST